MSSELPRFGIKWQGPENPIAVSMDDGYWTPWHIANDLLSRAPMELSDSESSELLSVMLRSIEFKHVENHKSAIGNAARKWLAEREKKNAAI